MLTGGLATSHLFIFAMPVISIVQIFVYPFPLNLRKRIRGISNPTAQGLLKTIIIN